MQNLFIYTLALFTALWATSCSTSAPRTFVDSDTFWDSSEASSTRDFQVVRIPCGTQTLQALVGQKDYQGAVWILPKIQIEGRGKGTTEIWIESGRDAATKDAFEARIFLDIDSAPYSLTDENSCSYSSLLKKIQDDDSQGIFKKVTRVLPAQPLAMRVKIIGSSSSFDVPLIPINHENVRIRHTQVVIKVPNREVLTQVLGQINSIAGLGAQVEMVIPIQVKKQFETSKKAVFLPGFRLADALEHEFQQKTHITEEDLKFAIAAILPKLGLGLADRQGDGATYLEIATDLADTAFPNASGLAPKDEAIASLRRPEVSANYTGISRIELKRFTLSTQVRGQFSRSLTQTVKLERDSGRDYSLQNLDGGETLKIKPLTLYRERAVTETSVRALSRDELFRWIIVGSPLSRFEPHEIEDTVTALGLQAVAFKSTQAKKDSTRFHWSIYENHVSYQPVSAAPFTIDSVSDLDSTGIAVSFTDFMPDKKFTLRELIQGNKDFSRKTSNDNLPWKARFDSETRTVVLTAKRDLGHIKVHSNLNQETERSWKRKVCQEKWISAQKYKERCIEIAYQQIPTSLREWTELTIESPRTTPSRIEILPESKVLGFTQTSGD